VPTYSKEDYERIAKAIGKSTAEVLQHENEFEDAATWYLLNIPPPKTEEESSLELLKQRSEKPKKLSKPRVPLHAAEETWAAMHAFDRRQRVDILTRGDRHLVEQQAHRFTADISRASASSPADRVATPRADIQRLRLLPVLGPILKPKELSTAAGVSSWTIETENIFVDVPDGLVECMIQLQLVPDQGLTVSSATIDFAAFQRTGLQVSDGGDRVSARAGATPRQIVIEAPATMVGKSIRLAASDPAGRIDALVLPG
jgi:hypothetical protein